MILLMHYNIEVENPDVFVNLKALLFISTNNKKPLNAVN